MRHADPRWQCAHISAARALRNLHLFNISGVPSVGLISSGINGLPWGVDAIALAISRDLFRAEADALYEEFAGYNEPDANEAYEKLAGRG